MDPNAIHRPRYSIASPINSAQLYARGTVTAQNMQKTSASAKYSAPRYARGTNSARIRQGYTASAKYSTP